MIPQKVYWDANPFLSFFQAIPNQMDACRQVLEAGERGEIKIVTSALTLTEVVYIKGRQKMTKKDEDLIQGWFEKPFIILMDVDRRIAERARQLIWQHESLKPKDSIHVASALVAKVESLHTFDEDLLKLNSRISSLKIIKPSLQQPQLPL